MDVKKVKEDLLKFVDALYFKENCDFLPSEIKLNYNNSLKNLEDIEDFFFEATGYQFNDIDESYNDSDVSSDAEDTDDEVLDMYFSEESLFDSEDTINLSRG